MKLTINYMNCLTYKTKVRTRGQVLNTLGAETEDILDDQFVNP